MLSEDHISIIKDTQPPHRGENIKKHPNQKEKKERQKEKNNPRPKWIHHKILLGLQRRINPNSPQIISLTRY